LKDSICGGAERLPRRFPAQPPVRRFSEPGVFGFVPAGRLSQEIEQCCQKPVQRCGEPFEIDRHGRQERLDAHILQTSTDCAGEPVPALRLAVEPFRSPAVALVKPSILFGPSLLASTRPQQGGMIVADNHRFVHAPR
jgi:hypothetical protein